MHHNKQALNQFKTYMVLGPNYQRERLRKPIFPKSIVHEIMQYAQYNDWMEIAFDLRVLAKSHDLAFITRSESWAQDPSLNEAKKWLANPSNPRITESYEFVDKTIMPLIHFLAKCPLVDYFHRTAWMCAAICDRAAALQSLLAVSGSPVNQGDKFGITSLMCAASHGNMWVLRTLLAMPGIDVNQVDNFGWTALMSAASTGRYRSLEVLLAVPGIDVNAVSKDGLTALAYAEEYVERYGGTNDFRLIKDQLAQQSASNQKKYTV